ncbi:P-loop NTPase [Chloroflexota bacterium]
MPTEKQILTSLEEVMVPGVMRSLTQMNLVREVHVTDHKVDLSIATAALTPPSQDWLKEKVNEVTRQIAGVEEVNVSFVDAPPKDLNKIGHVVTIMSGKGGVGKSLVASLTAVALRRQGYEVGILDADITGPSIPRMFGIGSKPSGSENGILPVSSGSGVEIMSINLLLPNEDDAVIWRGPLIGKVITQFWEEVLWGNLDYLVVDLPPGTADAPLTVMQTLPVSGVIIVFTPQDLTAMIVKKAVRMAQQMEKRVLGVVENMSYLHTPETGKNVEIFGKSRAVEMSRATNAPLLGKIPIDPELARLCDEGNIESYESEIINHLGESLPRAMPVQKKKGAE